MGIMDNIPELDAKGLRSFGLTTGALVAGIFGVAIPWIFDLGYPVWPWIVLAVLGILGLVVPLALNPVYKGWMVFGLLLSKITTPIIMGSVFFLVLFPTGLIMRLFRSDALNRELDPDAVSYRVDSEEDRIDHFEKPF